MSLESPRPCRSRRPGGLARPTRPSPPTRPTRRGIALLLVLVALVLGLTAATIAAQVAVTSGITRRLDRAVREADDVAASLSPRIERWLLSESQRAVVPPERDVPAIGIADEEVELPSGSLMRVCVTAFDQHGMVPWSEVLSNGPLSGYLSPGTIGSVTQAPRGTNESPIPPGLDLLDSGGSRRVWPGHVPVNDNTSPKRFARTGSPLSRDDAARSRENDRSTSSGSRTAGSFVATHVGSSRPAINVNTAPRSLVAMAESLTGRSVWSVVEEARRQGKPASVGAFADAASAGFDGVASARDQLPVFVASSDVWSFRVDVTVDRARSSWWLTYVRSDRGWALRQRLRITG